MNIPTEQIVRLIRSYIKMIGRASASRLGLVKVGSGLSITDAGVLSATGGSQDTFKTIAVSGQSDVVADSATDTLTLAAGSNIEITTNAGTDTVTVGLAATPALTGIELGHATDTTIARASAGQISVEGVNVLMNGGALGTPSSGTLTSCTGLPISTGVSGLGSNVATFLGTPSGANFKSAISDENTSMPYAFRPASWNAGSTNNTTPALNDDTLYTAASTTVTIPSGAIGWEAYGCGGGGGGGSGGTATTGSASGGYGGQGGQGGFRTGTISEMGWTAGTTQMVVVAGTGSSGGTAVAGNTNSNGNTGTAGVASTITVSAVTIVKFPGGPGGWYGATGSPRGTPRNRVAGYRGATSGSMGIGGSATASEGQSLAGSAGGGGGVYCGGGGGGGGSVSNSGTTQAGGAGGAGNTDDSSDGVGGGGTAGSSPAGAGGVGSNQTYGGDGGGGGGSGNAATAGAGNNGGTYGAGGGGGGAYRGTNGAHTSGAGGNGANGYVRLRFW